MEMLTSGASALQIAQDDVLSIRIPQNLFDEADEISGQYSSVLGKFEPVTKRVRREICRASEELNKLIIQENLLEENGREFILKYKTEDTMLKLLGILKPDMF